MPSRDDIHEADNAGAGVENTLTPGAIKEILCVRARALAEERAPETNLAARNGRHVVFRVAGETYAIGLPHVREVAPLRELTPVPCAPAFVAGIFNLRGQIISAIDLKGLFVLPDTNQPGRGRVVILDGGGMTFGILADSILGTRVIAPVAMESSLPTLTGIREDYLEGVTNDGTTILDGAKLLRSSEIVVDEKVQ